MESACRIASVLGNFSVVQAPASISSAQVRPSTPETRPLGRIAYGIGHPLELLPQEFFERLPVDAVNDFVQETVLLFAASGNSVGKAGRLGSTLAHGRLHLLGWRI